ncbi:NAD-dependent epimerase/dehydratase family protein [Reichenbachiella agarivorans]|uniref:NAD-dependent epimerase/dehydratase family protein n=1 Tax=Reichenbachiella agarivorans TaxID=2979464 RepID=A0ABY6CQY8_9BACT|nr:NAD-dependent epimerase/dehydratase family protein [Reichenbachiella agarivorans]UXP32926.1 NAD-dependent epimerase/dehydratase family protein [Reichenbachiella agarivorans]
MHKTLVTGGAGFIGSHVARQLWAMKHHVVILDDLSGGLLENIPTGVDFVKGSILDHQLLAELFEKYQFDYVYHLAAYAAEGLSHFIKRFNYQNNLTGSVNLLNECIKHEVKCFVFVSSIAVYGSQQTPMTEDMIPQPEDPYGIAKYAFEMELKASKEMFGQDYIIFRPHNVYGENQNLNDPYRNVLGIFMNQILNGEPLTIYGDGSQTRAFSYIDEVAPVIARSVENPSAYGEIFNIGSDHTCSVRDLAQMIQVAFDSQATIHFLDERKEVHHAFCAHDKLKAYFAPVSSVSLQEGIVRMAGWAKKAERKASYKFDEIEIYKNLPSNWKLD